MLGAQAPSFQKLLKWETMGLFYPNICYTTAKPWNKKEKITEKAFFQKSVFRRSSLLYVRSDSVRTRGKGREAYCIGRASLHR